MPEEKESGPVPNVRTFEQDVAESMQTKHATVLNVALAEREHEDIYAEDLGKKEVQKGRGSLLYIISFILIIGAIGILIFAINFYKQPKIATIPKDLVQKVDLVISNETLPVEVDLKNNAKSLASLSDTTSINTVLGTITKIVPYVSEETPDNKKVNRELTSQEFFAVLDKNVPDIFKRALKDEFSLLRVSDGGLQTSLVLKTNDYERTIVGLTSWEKNIVNDLEILFGYSRKIEVKERIETITNIETEEKVEEYDPKTKKIKIVVKKVLKPVSTFEDRVSYSTDEVSFSNTVRKNIELRVATGTTQKEYLVYGFPERNTLIIAGNTEAFLRIVDKLKKTN